MGTATVTAVATGTQPVISLVMTATARASAVTTPSQATYQVVDLRMAALWVVLVAAAAVGILLRLAVMAWRDNFESDDNRLQRRAPRQSDRRMRGANADARSREIEYHNKAIYGDFEFFFKVTLAIVGGTAYVAASRAALSAGVAHLLIRAGGWLELLAGTLITVSVCAHQKSKIERWREGYGLVEVVFWQEFWMAVGMITVSITYCAWLVPQLVRLLG